MRTFIYFPAFLLLFLLNGNVCATAQDDFNNGVKFFKQQNYQLAVQSFLNAQKKGFDTPALFHNIGVSYFKLGNYPQAKKYFVLARQYPGQKFLAEYNLGLIAKKQNNLEVANQQFTLVKEQATDNKLVTLAKIQLGETKVLEPDPFGSIYAEISYGHDDNITTIPDSTTTVTKKSSNYTDLYVGGNIQLLGNIKSGIALRGFISSFNYHEYNQYDDSRRSLGIEAAFPLANWANRLLLSQQEIKYAHMDYQKISRFQAKTKYPMTRNASLRIGYLHDDINSQNPTYDYLAGTRQRLRTGLRYTSKAHYAKIYHELEKNNRANMPTANFSPTRNTLRAYYEYSITSSIDLGGDINYRTSVYPAKATTNERIDKRTRLGLKLTYHFNKTWKIRAQLKQTDNESNNKTYTYQRNEQSLTLIAKF